VTFKKQKQTQLYPCPRVFFSKYTCAFPLVKLLKLSILASCQLFCLLSKSWLSLYKLLQGLLFHMADQFTHH